MILLMMSRISAVSDDSDDDDDDDDDDDVDEGSAPVAPQSTSHCFSTTAFRDSPEFGPVANIACVNFLIGLPNLEPDNSDDDAPNLVSDDSDDDDDDDDDDVDEGSASVARPVSSHGFPIVDSSTANDEDGSIFAARPNATVSSFLASVNPVALVGHFPTDYYWDNACSIHITSNKTDLAHLMELANPFPIGGIGSSVIATHVGHLSFLPPELSRCYYVAKASHNLISLGFIHANGGSYKTSGRNCMKVYGVNGELIDTSVRLHTNLYPVSVSPSLSACPAVAQLQGLPHVTATQRDEMDRAEALHQGQAAHVNDYQLCQDISNGLFNGCGVTPAMVRMNRRYRGRSLSSMYRREG
jgi:hypothetical protein